MHQQSHFLLQSQASDELYPDSLETNVGNLFHSISNWTRYSLTQEMAHFIDKHALHDVTGSF